MHTLPSWDDLARVLEAGEDGLCVLDADDRYTYANTAAARMLGATITDLIGKQIWEELPRAASVSFYTGYQRARHDDAPIRIECWHSPTDLWFDVRFVPSDAGRMLIHSRDITARIQAEERVHQTAALQEVYSGVLRLALDSMAEAVIVADADGYLVHSNQAAQKLSPYCAALSSLSTKGVPSSGLFYPDGVTPFPFEEMPLVRALRGEASDGVCLAFLDRSSLTPGMEELRLLSASGRPIWDAEGHITGGVIVFRDVTDEHRTAAALQAREAQLAEAQEVGSIGGWDYVLATHTLSWSAQMFRLFGRSLEEGIPSVEWVLQRVLPDDVSLVHQHLSPALSTGSPYAFDFRIRQNDGAIRWLHARGRSEQEESGRVSRLVGTMQDITERKRLEESQTLVRREAEEAQERLHFALKSARMIAWEWDLSVLDDPVADIDAAMVSLLPAEAGGHHVASEFFARVHPEDRATLRRLVQESIHTAMTEGEAQSVFDVEYRLMPASSLYLGAPPTEHLWVSARGRVQCDPLTGKPTRLMGVRWGIEEQKRAEAERAERARRDRQVADTLQASLLPRTVPDAVPGFQIGTVCVPLLTEEASVGGDFYDVFPLTQGKTALVVGDVMGKGLIAALSIAEVRFALRGFLREDVDASPSRALQRLNHFLLEAQVLEKRTRNALVSLSLAVVDTATGEADIAVAGADPPLLLRAAEGVERLDIADLILGAAPTPLYASSRVQLNLGDLLVFTTDGITEARRFSGQGSEERSHLFGLDGVIGSLRSSVGAASPDLEQAGRTVIEQARAHAGGALQDDACLLLAQRCPL